MTEQLYNAYGDQINFVILYVIEPHPYQQICPYTGNYWLNSNNDYKDPITGKVWPLYQPTSYEWRIDQATRMKEQLLTKVPAIPVAVDRMDNPFWCTYGPAPNIGYLIDTTGTIVGKVPWYNPRNNGNVTIEPAIQSLLSK